METLIRAGTACGDAGTGKTASPNTPVAFDPVPVFTGPAPGSATAIQPPATLATLAASPAAAAKAAGASAFAPSAGSDADALPGKVKPNGKPVRLHSPIEDKTASATGRRSVHGKRGARFAAKTPPRKIGSAVKPDKRKVSKRKVSKPKGKSVSKRRIKGRHS